MPRRTLLLAFGGAAVVAIVAIVHDEEVRGAVADRLVDISQFAAAA